MKVIVLPAAEADLIEIGSFISLDDARAADRLVSDLLDRCDSLENRPRRGRVIAKRRWGEVRMIVHSDYLIVYTIDGDVVHVRRIRHGARSPKLLLKDLDLA